MDAGRPEPRPLSRVISPREARLVFWLIVIALVGVIGVLGSGIADTLTGPAVILFVAWLMAYVLEPAVTWLTRHVPFHSRGLAVAVTYLITVIVTIAVLLGAGAALLSAALEFVDRLPAIRERVRELVEPLAASMGLTPPAPTDIAAAIADQVAENGEAIGDAAQAAVHNVVVVVAALFTAVVISVGMAAGEVTLLGWLRRFLPERSYADIAALERAIALSFGGFIRGRGLIGLIFGVLISIAAVLLDVPFAPLIAVIAGLIQFIPFIGPLLGWTVLPAFAVVLAPDVAVPALVISLLIAVILQMIVTRLVMGRAVKISVAAVLSVVMLGTAIAGVMGAIFAIPTAAAILAISDYLRKRDVLLRAADADDAGTAPADTDRADPETGEAESPLVEPGQVTTA
jgi:predicted PurR-regulated permease PerM